MSVMVDPFRFLLGAETLAGHFADTLGGEKNVMSISAASDEVLIRDTATPGNRRLATMAEALTYTSPSTKYITNPLGLLEAGTTLRCDHDLASKTTSTSSVRLARGSKTFALAEAYTYAVGDIVRVSVPAYYATTYGVGIVTAASSGAVTIKIYSVKGSGVWTSWTLIRARGLLIEEQRTNLLTYSSAFSHGSWIGAGTITGDAGVAPDGSMTADRLAFTSVSYAGRLHGISVVAGTTYTFSVWIYKESGGGLTRIELAGGVWGVASVYTTTIGDGWQRLTVTGTASGTGAANVFVYPEYSVNRTGSYLLWGAQVEVGTFATSNIETTTSTVTRGVDAVSLATSAFPWNAVEGSFIETAATNGYSDPAAQFAYHLEVSDGTSANRLGAWFDNQNLVKGATGSVVIGASIDPSYATLGIANVYAALGGRTRFGFAYKTDDFATVANGGTPAADNSGSLPTVNGLRFGGSAAVAKRELNGHLLLFKYLPRRIPNAQLQAETV